MSGSTPTGLSGLKLFGKNNTPATTPAATVPDVPTERIVSSPRRQIGRGRRDTVLTGADGVS